VKYKQPNFTMRFKLHLRPMSSRPRIMWNYHYPLSAFLYSKIASADENYSAFLHDTGYILNKSKSFKHFTFSDLRCKIGKSDTKGFEVISPLIEWTVSFYIDKAAESFIVGLFQDQEIRLFDKFHDASFMIERVETLSEPVIMPTTRLKATSAMVVAEKINDMDQYLEPTDERFSKYLIDGLRDKYLSAMIECGEKINPDFQHQEILFKLTEGSNIKSRKVTIKDGKSSATEVRGFRNFEFELTAPEEIIKVGLYGGMGKEASQGFGFCEVVG
jgi:CRISPR-associated endoribonuclease Cas6